MPQHGIPVRLSRPAGMSLRFAPSVDGRSTSTNDLDFFPLLDHRVQRAWRKSCDRCHSQKLKCSSSTQASPSGRCSRCTKSGLPCTFSTRSARQSKIQNQNQIQFPESELASESRGQPSRLSLYGKSSTEQTGGEFDWSACEDAEHQKINHASNIEQFNEQLKSPATLAHVTYPSDTELGYFDWDLTSNHFEPSKGLSSPGATNGSHREFSSSLGEYSTLAFLDNNSDGTTWAARGSANNGKSNQGQSLQRADDPFRDSSQYSQQACEFLDKHTSDFSWMDQTSSLQLQLEKLETDGSRTPQCLEDLYNYPIGESLQRAQQFLASLKNKNSMRAASLTPASSSNAQPNTFDANIFSETLESDYFQSALSSPATNTISSSARRTTSIIFPLTSYVILVQIIAHQSHQLCLFLDILESQPSSLVTGSISNVRDMYSPLSQPLNCIFRAIMGGIELLKGIEAELEIPAWLSVDCTDDEQMRDLGEENLASRIVSALWEGEGLRPKRDELGAGRANGDGEDSKETESALAVLRRCVVRVRVSMKRHVGL